MLLRPLALAAATLGVTATVAFAATINGTNGSDILIGTNAADTINAQSGNDRVFGLGAGDVIAAGQGDDVVYGDGSCPAGTTNPDYCSTAEAATDGADNITGSDGSDRLFGLGGGDNITG